ncbi:MAG TPA: RagB/SusD family nutrient uptake outer membrane protein, partial [Niastella sp.]|nr:RagB/SusD family nutrient uptake outer membrane protein [Niastella sp.]
MNRKKRIDNILLILLLFAGISSCKKYLDVIPDNVATIEHAFKLRIEAEKYLFTLYSYMPKSGDGWYNPAFMGGDEIWLPETAQDHWHPIFRIARGEQNKDLPLFDEWAGRRKGNGTTYDTAKIWWGINHCNIFLENLHDLTKVPDISISERERWIGEAEFLKAYYHFYMLRMYGPIP